MTKEKNLQKVKDDIKELQKMNSDWFNEYKKLGGKKSKKQYFENLGIFFEETLGVFTGTDEPLYDSREEALEAVKREAKITYKELNLIFESVDNVTAYT